MAIYVYTTATGQLYSYSPNDTDPVADAGTLAANGLTAVKGLPQLDATHAWDPGTKTVVIVVPPKSIPTLLEFWRRFTQTEREAIENLVATGTQATKNRVNAFRTYAESSGFIDCNDPYVLSSVQALETAGVIAVGRAAQIVV